MQYNNIIEKFLMIFLPEDQENGGNTIHDCQIQNKDAVWFIEERSTSYYQNIDHQWISQERNEGK